MHGAIDREAAASLARRVLGGGAAFTTFRAAAFVGACRGDIAAFSLRELPELCRSLRGRTVVVPESRRGRLTGRLDVPRTLASRLRGDAETLSSRVRTRRFDHPAEVLVRAVTVRLLEVFGALRRAWGDASPSWAGGVIEWEVALRHSLERTTLRRVDEVAFSSLDPRVLEGHRHPAFASARVLLEALRGTLDDDDPLRLARWLCRASLWPLEPWQRFELAVGLTLAQRVEERLQRGEPGRWSVRHAVIEPQREDIVAFDTDDGRRIRIFYNQSPLVGGARRDAIGHYFGDDAASRPDFVVVGERPGRPRRAVVVEVKLSENPAYLHRGYDEALAYSIDYSDDLVARVGAVLVTKRSQPGAPRPTDKVVVIGWPDWPRSEVVLDAVISTVADG